MSARIAWLGGVLLLFGCISSSTELLGEERHAATNRDTPIPVYELAADVPRPFTKVALVRACSESSTVGLTELLERLKDEARAAGAHALILRPTTVTPTGSVTQTEGTETHTSEFHQVCRLAVAIRFHEP